MHGQTHNKHKCSLPHNAEIFNFKLGVTYSNTGSEITAIIMMMMMIIIIIIIIIFFTVE
jgi:hypothetical protein